MRKLALLLAAVAALFAFAAPAAAATLIVTNGQLIGATGVNVNGTLYDVVFVDGTCQALFDGCAGPIPPFSADQASATAAAQALLDQVFIDSLAGQFDSQADLVTGCEPSASCSTVVPYFSLGGVFFAAAAVNGQTPDADLVDSNFALSPFWDTTQTVPTLNFARFTLSADQSGVPEPSTWTMMLLGFGAIGFAARRSRRVEELFRSRLPGQ